jgi:hypothetical protein
MRKASNGNNYLLEAACERASDILMLHEKFQEQKPVMLLELPSQRIYAYPYLEFKNTLSDKSQKKLEQEYLEAQQNKQFVVFVRDEVGQKMISFSVNEAE